MRVISSDNGRFRVNDASWAMVLRLAYTHGWRPAGTREPDGFTGLAPDGETPRLWNPKNYWARRGQHVSDEDAAAMASALESALPDIPDHDAMGHKVVSTIDMPDGREWRFISPFKKFNPYEYFSGTSKPKLIRFIAFLNQGGFTIGR